MSEIAHDSETYQNPEELFNDVARQIRLERSIVTGVEGRAFVLKDSIGRYAYVGFREDDDMYVVGQMRRKTQRIGTHDPKIKESDITSVECTLYRLQIESPTDTDRMTDELSHRLENGLYDEEIDTGWQHGWYQTPLEDVLEDVFKWY